jgi:hypothetical protein
VNDETAELELEVTEEDALTALRAVTGDDELSLDDLQTYSKDRKGWLRSQNERNEQLAAKEKTLDDKIENLDRAEQRAVQNRTPQPQPVSEADLEKSFYKTLNIDLSDPTAVVEINPNQLFKVWQDLRNSILLSRNQFSDVLEAYGITQRGKDGKYQPPENLTERLKRVESVAVETQEQWNGFLMESFLDQVQDKHPDADRGELSRIARESTSQDVEAEIWDAAKAQQDTMDSKVTARVKSENKRRNVGSRTASMAGRGAPSLGKKPIANPLNSKTGRRALMDRARRRTEEAEAV